MYRYIFYILRIVCNRVPIFAMFVWNRVANSSFYLWNRSRVSGTQRHTPVVHFKEYPLPRAFTAVILGTLGSLRIDDDAVGLRDISTAHAHLGTCRHRDKVDDVGESDLPASWKQQDVRLFFKVFSLYFRCFCQIFQVSP